MFLQSPTDSVEVGPGTVADVTALTDGLGVDVAIEAVGYMDDSGAGCRA